MICTVYNTWHVLSSLVVQCFHLIHYHFILLSFHNHVIMMTCQAMLLKKAFSMVFISMLSMIIIIYTIVIIRLHLDDGRNLIHVAAFIVFLYQTCSNLPSFITTHRCCEQDL